MRLRDPRAAVTSCWPLLLFIGLGLTAACGEETPDDEDDCPLRWSGVTTNPEATVDVRGGALELQIRAEAASDLILVTADDLLEEDFQVIVRFAGLDRGSSDAYVEALVFPTEVQGDSIAKASLSAGKLAVAVQFANEPPIDEFRTEESATAGSFEMTRTGEFLALASKAGDVEAKGSGLFSTEALSLGIAVGKRGTDDVDGLTSVRITNVEIHGGGGYLHTDNFKCDSMGGLQRTGSS